jgi:hypothetical protein
MSRTSKKQPKSQNWGVMTMLILTSMLFAIFILYVIYIQLREYNEISIAKYRFKYFALRDQLAMLVVEGKLNENSWEYEHIIGTINFHIGATETMSIMRILDMLMKYHTSAEEEREVQILEKKVDNQEIAAIVAECMSITFDLIRRNSRVQIFLIMIAKYVLIKICGTKKVPKHEIILNPNKVLSKLKERKSSFEKILVPAIA